MNMKHERAFHKGDLMIDTTNNVSFFKPQKNGFLYSVSWLTDLGYEGVYRVKTAVLC